MIKKFEGFKDLFNKLNYPRSNHWFQDYEIEELKELGFYEDKDNKNTFVYNIQSINKIKQIRINKIANQLPDIQGFVSKYKITLVYDNNKYKYEYFKYFESSLEYAYKHIPIEEIDAYKYNI